MERWCWAAFSELSEAPMPLLPPLSSLPLGLPTLSWSWLEQSSYSETDEVEEWADASESVDWLNENGYIVAAGFTRASFGND